MVGFYIFYVKNNDTVVLRVSLMNMTLDIDV